jgi:hypothetical protein
VRRKQPKGVRRTVSELTIEAALTCHRTEFHHFKRFAMKTKANQTEEDWAIQRAAYQPNKKAISISQTGSIPDRRLRHQQDA